MGETLIESTHPKCISIQLSSLSDDRNQHNKESLFYEGSHADKKIYTNADSSALIYTCPKFSPETGGNVCKLMKPQRNSSDLLSKGDATEKSKEGYCRRSCISSKHHSLRMFKDGCDSTVALVANLRDIVEEENVLDDQRHHLRPHYVPNIVSGEGYEACTKSSVTYRQQPELEHNSSGNDRCSSSKSNNVCGLDFRNSRADVHGECSSSGNIAEEQLDKFNSVREMCIFLLKSHGLLGRLRVNKTCASHEFLNQEVQDSAKYSQLCKGCRHTGSPLKMLICDLCEEAFHISCCIPRVRKLPTDEWYCRSCSKKIRKTRFRAKPEAQPSGSSRRLSYCDQSPIQVMLTDRRPYTTSVRIGKDFQAEVPEWSGPVHSDYDASEEPCKLDPVEYTNHSDWCYGKRKKSSFIGNWVQCREVIFGNDDDEGTVCGKWRRAPLSVVQTDNWDCSCALPWDPIHADYAVPRSWRRKKFSDISSLWRRCGHGRPIRSRRLVKPGVGGYGRSQLQYCFIYYRKSSIWMMHMGYMAVTKSHNLPGAVLYRQYRTPNSALKWRMGFWLETFPRRGLSVFFIFCEQRVLMFTCKSNMTIIWVDTTKL